MKHNPGFLNLVNEDENPRAQMAWPTSKISATGRNHFAYRCARSLRIQADSLFQGDAHLGKGIIERDIESRIPDKEAPIVLYCGGGFRSVLAAENLQKMGYHRVISIDGGIKAWREAGYPMEKAHSFVAAWDSPDASSFANAGFSSCCSGTPAFSTLSAQAPPVRTAGRFGSLKPVPPNPFVRGDRW
ncbi:MAG: rhodanese-like domain-containing protein [Nitrospiraceae bacterium]